MFPFYDDIMETDSTELHKHEPRLTVDMNKSTNLLNVISDDEAMALCRGICVHDVRKYGSCFEIVGPTPTD